MSRAVWRRAKKPAKLSIRGHAPFDAVKVGAVRSWLVIFKSFSMGSVTDGKGLAGQSRQFHLDTAPDTG